MIGLENKESLGVVTVEAVLGYILGGISKRDWRFPKPLCCINFSEWIQKVLVFFCRLSE